MGAEETDEEADENGHDCQHHLYQLFEFLFVLSAAIGVLLVSSAHSLSLVAGEHSGYLRSHPGAKI